MVKYGYARVSTKGQERNGNGLEEQINKLKEEGCSVIFSETFTGMKKERPEFQKMLKSVKEGDTIVVTKLDRFARSAADAINTIEDLFEKGVKVHILNMGLIEDTPTGRLILTIFSGFARFERDMIVERTQEGKALARKNPEFKDGRPPTHKKKALVHALQLLENHTYREVEEMTGISKSTLGRAKLKYESGQLV